MAHREQIEWCNQIKEEYSEYFINKRVLDIGALDINGNNRHLFKDCEYIGLDVVKGKNVDVVSIAHEYKPDELFDVIISTNALEHDMYFKKTLKKMIELIKPNGFIFFTAAHTFKEHGTLRTTPHNSGTTQMGEEWGNYYHNIEKNDIIEVFERYNYMFKWSYLEVKGPDIRFWGVMNEVTNHSFKIAWGVSDHAIIIKTIAEGLNKAGVLNRYLELGIWKGYCFNFVAPFAKQAYAVDTNDCYKYINGNKNMVWYHGRTTDFLENHNKDEKFDLVFIDANHSHKASLEDFNLVLPLVNENGLILLHDTYPPDKNHLSPGLCHDTYKTAEYIKREYSHLCEIATLPFYYGISIVRKLNRQLLWRM